MIENLAQKNQRQEKIIYAWVPGLPHILRPELNPSYAALSAACREVGQEFQRRKVSRILYYSTQWLSVLGQSVQTRPRLSGLHVDENWYDIASLKFEMTTDIAFAQRLVSESKNAGFQVRAVDYEGFPVDTGTIVANQLLNPASVPVAMYSCCVYSDYAETVKIGSLAAHAAESLDGVTAVVVVSGLSGRYFTTAIDYREDHIREKKDDDWNRKVLAAMNNARWSDLDAMRADYCRDAKVDMGLKGLAFMAGAGACEPGKKLVTKAYGPIYGTGAAVLVGQ